MKRINSGYFDDQYMSSVQTTHLILGVLSNCQEQRRIVLTIGN